MRVWQSFKKSISFPYHILLLSFCSIFLNKVKLKYFIPQLPPRKYLPIFTRLLLSLLACPHFFKESFHTSTKKVSPTFSQTFQPWSSATPQHEKEGCKEVCLNQMNMRMIWISPGGQEKASQVPQPTLRNVYQHQSASISTSQHQSASIDINQHWSAFNSQWAEWASSGTSSRKELLSELIKQYLHTDCIL